MKHFHLSFVASFLGVCTATYLFTRCPYLRAVDARIRQDVLVVTAPSSGAEVIPFLKTYVNLPGAVIFTVLYSKLCNSAEQVGCHPAEFRSAENDARLASIL